MSEVKVNKLSPRNGTTVTIGDSGDTINIVGTLQNNGAAIPGDISSVVAGTGLSGGGTSGDVTINIEAAQPTITSTGTLTGFTSTGIDDNASGTSLTIASDGRTTLDATNEKAFVVHHSDGSNVRIGMNNNTTNSNEIAYEGTDFVIKPGGTEKARLNSTGLGIGTSSPTGALDVVGNATITTADNSNTLSLVSTDADATSGPRISMRRESGSPADNDIIGQIYFTGKDDGGNNTDYASIRAKISDATHNTEDGALEFQSYKSGFFNNALTLGPTETVFNDDSVDIDFRVESNGNANMLYVDGGNDRVGIGTSNPTEALEVTGDLKINSTGSVMEGISITPASAGSTSLLLNTFNGGVANDRNWAIRNRYNANGRLEIMRSTNNTGDSLTSVMTFERDGDVVVKQDLYVDASGAGIFLGGASTNNKLDDYEEGTFTPTVTGATSGSFTTGDGATTGSYVKIGNQVTVRGEIHITGSSSPVGSVRVGNLPFTCAALTELSERTSGSCWVKYMDLESTTRSLVVFISQLNSYFQFYEINDNANVTVINSAEVTAPNAEFAFSLTYQTS